MNESAVLLEMRDVTKSYPASPAPLDVLKGVSLHLKQGESVAVVGPSGCGKSTLLNLIGTLDTPSSGSIYFEGRDLGGLNSQELARFRNTSVGFVFQSHHLLPQCTALDNVLVPALVNDGAQVRKARALDLLERVGLLERAAHRPGQLSGGERQRVAVVRALINQPRLLLADEPTGALNEEAAAGLVALLLELSREEGMTLVVVTHAKQVAAQMDRVLELHDGLLKPEEPAA
ncbi:MAG TPA: ABC transporter ATP-binding protein [Candidatus Hydrogenedentes bacterium]|jgi:ABC-type lipoprotein export system ATPase subunit|nr:ABC transporter ATP-binding protein [Candidatus Hydrogenedentota bacterium]HPK00803.1 ABC transporter ATP-binding protein [Candidatus Hydrogenedentota bacterium]